jgi:hypothetical protein
MCLAHTCTAHNSVIDQVGIPPLKQPLSVGRPVDILPFKNIIFIIDIVII